MDYQVFEFLLNDLCPSGQMLAVGVDAFAVGKVRPHQLVLVHNDRQPPINPQQHQQVGRCKNVRKMEHAWISSEIKMPGNAGHEKPNFLD